jgi:hypothetical protein
MQPTLSFLPACKYCDVKAGVVSRTFAPVDRASASVTMAPSPRCRITLIPRSFLLYVSTRTVRRVSGSFALSEPSQLSVRLSDLMFAWLLPD